MSRKTLKRLVSVASGLEAKTKGGRVSSSLVSDNGTSAVFRTNVPGSQSHYESESTVVGKQLPRDRWLAQIP